MQQRFSELLTKGFCCIRAKISCSFTRNNLVSFKTTTTSPTHNNLTHTTLTLLLVFDDESHSIRLLQLASVVVLVLMEGENTKTVSKSQTMRKKGSTN